jgi:GT2 family glycosyltransferase
MVTARRYGYIGWPRYPTPNPRARVLWNAIFKLPAGRLLTALRAFPSFPGPALRASLWALAEPLAALAITLPEVLRFDLESASLQLDYLSPGEHCPRVGVVVVHHQQPELLAACLRSLQAIDYPNLDTVVVDSGSDAARHERLCSQFPRLDWVLSTENVGYSGGNNLGIARLLDRGCEYLLLLNADTECCAPDFVRRLVRFLDLNPRVALAGPRVYLRRPGEVQNTILRYPSLFRNVVDWFGFRLFPALYRRSGDRVRPAEMLNGVCVMLRAAAIRQVGAFDPHYFMYVEDADLGLRLRRSGWQLAYVPIDSIIHHQKETGYELDSPVSLLIRRNAVYFLRKHHRQAQAWGLAAANLILSVARACASTSAQTFRNRLAFSRALWREFRTVLRAAE